MYSKGSQLEGGREAGADTGPDSSGRRGLEAAPCSGAQLRGPRVRLWEQRAAGLPGTADRGADGLRRRARAPLAIPRARGRPVR